MSPSERPIVEERRHLILDAAYDCARKAGFHGASMAEIAKTARLSVGQIYRYFENKEAIIAALVARGVARQREKYDQALARAKDRDEVIAEQCRGAIEQLYDQPNAALMLEVHAEAARNPKVAEIVRMADVQERALGHHLLEYGRRPGEDEGQLAARAEVLSMLIDGMAIRAIYNPDIDREALLKEVERAVRFLVNGGGQSD